MAGNETTVKPSPGYIADAISPPIRGDVLHGIVDVTCTEATTKLCLRTGEVMP
jgi:hypothetical protein